MHGKSTEMKALMLRGAWPCPKGTQGVPKSAPGGPQSSPRVALPVAGASLGLSGALFGAIWEPIERHKSISEPLGWPFGSPLEPRGPQSLLLRTIATKMTPTGGPGEGSKTDSKI